MIAANLAPWPVAGPLAVAGILLATSKLLPRRVPDVAAILTALAAAALCATLAHAVGHEPLTYWFGGWSPRGEQTIGIAFRIDLAGAFIACALSLLFVAALVFAWGFFDEVHAHFHVLMLLFLAAMIGFCLTGDVFNMFVWFEVMSVAAYALTGYSLEESPLEGAINFTVVNTIGSYLLLGGIGLIYSVAGSLDMVSIGRAVARAPADPVLAAAFVLMATGLLVKGAQVPFHFWLPDAHAVAPSPVSVIFSGAMVPMGLFGLLRLVTMFAASPGIMAVVHDLLLGLGAASAVLGAAMALLQRHVKRMLAFSTVSHAGIMLVGLALTTPGGLAGMLAYMLGHGAVKAALFMVSGILLSACGSVDEIHLRNCGRRVWPAGIAMALGGLLLAGLPLGAMDEGFAAIEGAAHAAGHGWVPATMVIAAAGTGAAVLRATGRVFLGLGATPGIEARSPTDQEYELPDRPLALMLLPAAGLLAAACLGATLAERLSQNAAHMLMPGPAAPASGTALAWTAVAIALLLAALSLAHGRLPRIGAAIHPITAAMATLLDRLHSGVVGDYVAWLVAGLAMFTAAFAWS